MSEGNPAWCAGCEAVDVLRAMVIRLRRKADAKLGQHHLRVRAKRRKDAGGAGHRGEDADLFTPAVPLECPCGGEADGRDTGHDAESLCHRTGTRQVNEFRFVHGLLQIKGEHGPPEEPDDVIASWWKGDRAQDAPCLCREVGELAAQGRSLGLGAAEVLTDAGDGRFDGPGFDVATQPCDVGFGERDGRLYDRRNG